MAESSAKVRLTLDGQQAIREADRVKRSMKGVGDEVSQWGSGLAKTLALSGALLGTMRAIASATAEARRESAQMSRESGDAAVRLSQAMNKLRVPSRQASVVSAFADLAPKAVADMMAAAASAGVPRTADFAGAARAAQTGAIGQDEIIRLLKSRRKIDVNAALESLSPAAISEINIRQQEQIKDAEARRSADPQQRIVERELALRRIRNPKLQAIADQAESISQYVGISQSDIIKLQMEGKTLQGSMLEGMGLAPTQDVFDALSPRSIGRSAQRINRRLGQALLSMIGVVEDGPVDAMDIDIMRRKIGRPIPVTNTRPQIGVNGEP